MGMRSLVPVESMLVALAVALPAAAQREEQFSAWWRRRRHRRRQGVEG
jgi:hypothetical protein